jgi:hypothetical protein
MSTNEERKRFSSNLVEARIRSGAGFCETDHSLIGETHLAFGRLYVLFNETAENPDEMLAGFVLHDLAAFPQSYPKPDLTHLPPNSVLECGELWANVAGGARLTRQAAWILAGRLGAKAILLYPILRPWNLTMSYVRDFDRIGEPIEWPYIQRVDGGKILVQAMVSQGPKLARMILEAGQWGFQASSDLSRIKFNSPFGTFIGPSLRRRQAMNGGRKTFASSSARWRAPAKTWSQVALIPEGDRAAITDDRAPDRKGRKL